MEKKNRPISPHLQIYNIFSKELTSGPSFFNRVTGVGLSVGIICAVVWLGAAANGPKSYDAFHAFITSWFGYLCLLGFSACYFYHVINGIRFMVWDLGYGFERETVFKSGIAMGAAVAFLFLLTWIIILFS